MEQENSIIIIAQAPCEEQPRACSWQREKTQRSPSPGHRREEGRQPHGPGTKAPSASVRLNPRSS